MSSEASVDFALVKEPPEGLQAALLAAWRAGGKIIPKALTKCLTELLSTDSTSLSHALALADCQLLLAKMDVVAVAGLPDWSETETQTDGRHAAYSPIDSLWLCRLQEEATQDPWQLWQRTAEKGWQCLWPILMPPSLPPLAHSGNLIHAWLLRPAPESSTQMSALIGGQTPSYWSMAVSLLRGRVTSIALASLLINLGLLSLPLFSMLMYDKVVHNGIFETLWTLTIGVSLFVILEVMLRLLRARQIDRLAGVLDTQVDAKIFAKLLEPSNRAGSQPGMAARYLTLYRDLTQAREFFSSAYLLALADMPFALLTVLLIGLIAWPLLLIVAVWLAIYVLANQHLKAQHRTISRTLIQLQTRKQALLADALSSLDVLRTSHAGDHLFQRFMRLSAQQSSQAALQRNGQTVQGLLTQVVYIGSSVSLLVVGAYLIFAQNLSVGALVAASMLNGRTMGVMGQALSTLGRWDELTRALQALQPYHQANEHAGSHKNMRLDQVASRNEASVAEANSLRYLSGSVQLQAVQHQFTQSRVDVLHPLSLSIAAGSCIGLLGRPGSGKSTLARILVGAIVPSAGQVLLDHRALSSYRRTELAAGLSFKPQEVTLIAGTVEENILMGILSTQNAVRTKALQRGIYFSGLDQDLKSGALSLSQWVEEYGANLSGGQRQKIALARALAHPSKLLVLDEPSNGLDPESETLLIARLKEITGVTKVLVTHSARLLAITERVIALDQGKLLADGPTAQLISKS